MIRNALAQLCFWAIPCLIIACHQPEAVAPITRSADLIAQITEGPFSSQYRYDQQGRLIGIITDGLVDSGEYNPTTAHAEYAFVYKPTKLIMTYKATRNGHSLQGEQHIPVNKQGLVTFAPSFVFTDNMRTPAAEFSSLLKNFLYPLVLGDTLRQYNGDGYLIQAENSRKSINRNLPNWSEYSRSNQTILDGNVTQLSLITQEIDTDWKYLIAPIRTQLRYSYDQTKPGLRNPYQFMGTTNLNLLKTKELLDGQAISYRESYSYERDAKGRPVRYTIRTNPNDSGISGRIEYVNP
ncbi:hypothetical protein GO755_19715 [Spirosoma sp. HMF4905]|uniref:DUF4595 domain-containing protein n=1 Tax=Spirosoma arboris TaxID=2682092 RepID=A0A7K1SEX4_9BACT|nr:hypothetical protein [Spirosoma arboris]MVM32284.1 hypothetical protein [Spirosoma arboris]